jgi:hypothetical protein
MFWVELTTPSGQSIWVNLATYRTMQRSGRDDVTHLISLALNSEGQPEVTTIKETPEEVLKLAGIAKKGGDAAAGVGFIRRASATPSGENG